MMCVILPTYWSDNFWHVVVDEKLQVNIVNPRENIKE